MRNCFCLKLSLDRHFLTVAVLAFMAVSLLSACSLQIPEPVMRVDPGETLHLYLQPLPQEAEPLTMRVALLSALRRDGQEIPLLEKPVHLSAVERIGRQTKLLQSQLPAGDYLGLNLHIDRASIISENGSNALLTAQEPQLLDQPFSIRPGQTTTLFLSLQRHRLVTDGYRLTAQFSLWTAPPPLTELKGLVSHPVAGTLTLFEKKTPRVYSVLALGQQPSGVALDPANRIAYVALSAEDMLVTIDLDQEQIERKIRLRASDRPRRLSLVDHGRNLVVTLSGSNALSVVDTRLFREHRRIHFATPPKDVIPAVDGSNAYVILPETNRIVLVDSERGSIDASITLVETPAFGCLSKDGSLLFMLTENSPDLLLIDSQTLQPRGRVFIGYGGSCLASTENGLIYVGLKNGEILIIDPRVALAIDQFQTGGGVVDITLDQFENSLFVLTDRQELEKYDMTSKKKLASLDLGMVGFELSVMGEL